MPFTVVSTPSAGNALLAIWLNSSDPRAVTLASDEIDRVLKYAPDFGQDSGDHRELTVAPLTVTYTFSPNDCLVTITDVRLIH